jgi:hypothetical protein
MTWIQETDALVGRAGAAMFKIFNLKPYSGKTTEVERRSHGAMSIALMAPGEHYIIAKVDSEEEGKSFSEWVARALDYPEK